MIIMSPFPRRSSGLQKYVLLPTRGMSLWALYRVWDIAMCTLSQEGSLLWKVTRALADGEVESVLPRDTERMLLPAFGTGSMNESYFKILSSKPLCLCWEPRMSLCTSSPAIPGGSSVLSQPFTNKECDRPVWWLPGLRFLLLIMLDISVFICWFIVLLFIASVILFSYCQVA